MSKENVRLRDGEGKGVRCGATAENPAERRAASGTPIPWGPVAYLVSEEAQLDQLLADHLRMARVMGLPAWADEARHDHAAAVARFRAGKK